MKKKNILTVQKQTKIIDILKDVGVASIIIDCHDSCDECPYGSCEIKLANAIIKEFDEKKVAQRILDGLESMANNAIYQGKLTINQMKLFFKEHYGLGVEQ